MTAEDFANYLTRKGVYTFNIHDIRKYASEFDRTNPVKTGIKVIELGTRARQQLSDSLKATLNRREQF